MKPFNKLKNIFKRIDSVKQFLKEIRDSIKLLIAQQDRLSQLLNASHAFDGKQSTASQQSLDSTKNVLAKMPLLLAEKTYNTAHPNYDANCVKNFPNAIYYTETTSQNTVYQKLQSNTIEIKDKKCVSDALWQEMVQKLMEEIQSIPHSGEVFERKAFIEAYTKDLNCRYRAHYLAGWVNLEDAFFLYWLVRMAKPKIIVQTGVCNGLSSAFMTLALVANSSEGKLFMIDLPQVFNPNDRDWTVSEKIYGVVIPEGKTSGWMIPEAYRNYCEIHCGDAKHLLPPLVDRLDAIDMFYHDSDHTYHHMMFEFQQAKRKLTKGGLVVADDISWNSSLWDFAEEHSVPAYNYKGSVGVVFF